MKPARNVSPPPFNGCRKGSLAIGSTPIVEAIPRLRPTPDLISAPLLLFGGAYVVPCMDFSGAEPSLLLLLPVCFQIRESIREARAEGKVRHRKNPCRARHRLPRKGEGAPKSDLESASAEVSPQQLAYFQLRDFPCDNH